MVVTFIAAAGKGKRMKCQGNKQFLFLCGKQILLYSLEAFENTNVVDNVVLIVNSEDLNYCNSLIKKSHFSKIIRVVAGGKERQDSIYEGIKVLPKRTDIVVIHDAARPLVASKVIEKAVLALDNWDGIVTGVPVKDTIKRADKDGLVETLKREEFWLAQTPQVFAAVPLLRSYSRARKEAFYGTDDASLLERAGYRVKVVPGSYENIKITTPEDLIVAEQILRRRQLQS